VAHNCVVLIRDICFFFLTIFGIVTVSNVCVSVSACVGCVCFLSERLCESVSACVCACVCCYFVMLFIGRKKMTVCTKTYKTEEKNISCFNTGESTCSPNSVPQNEIVHADTANTCVRRRLVGAANEQCRKPSHLAFVRHMSDHRISTALCSI